jgi:hypothetical protein
MDFVLGRDEYAICACVSWQTNTGYFCTSFSWRRLILHRRLLSSEVLGFAITLCTVAQSKLP